MISYNMHIASGSDQNELHYMCNKLCINKCFKMINGSPISKTQLIKKILNNNSSYLNEGCIVIGDIINTFEAAKENNIHY